MQTSSATATANIQQQIFSDTASDTLFGAGSEVALMARKALAQALDMGLAPEIWAVGVAEPSGGTAAIHKITVASGTAAAGSDIVFKVGETTFRASVSSGDDQDAAALAIKAALDESPELLPVSIAIDGVNANEVNLTFKYKGENGNDLNIAISDVGLSGLGVTASRPTDGVGVSTITTALANALAKDFETVAIGNHKAADITAIATHMASAWAPAEKRWRFAIIGENGTLSTANTLSAAADSEKDVVVSYENSPSLPGQIAAATAVAISARELPNYNFDYHDLLLAIPPEASIYTAAEIESALAAGTTPLIANDARTSTQIVRLITTKTTENSAPFERLKDLATIRGMVFVARQIDTDFSVQFRAVNKSARVLKRMRSRAYDKLKVMERLGITQNVDVHFPQLLVESDEVVPTRAVVSIPESIVPNLHQIVNSHVLYVE